MSGAGTIAKTKYIKKYGSKVMVRKYVSGAFEEYQSVAVLGRGSRTNVNMKLLQSFRQGILPADVDIDSGYFIEDVTQKENFIVGGTLPEYGVNQTLSIVVNLLLCNSELTIRCKKSVADARGNLKTSFVTTAQNIPCHVQEVTNELKQMDAGVLPNTDYLIYSTKLEVAEIDQLQLGVNGGTESFKVLAKDYITYPNMVVIQVSRDIRE